MSALHTIRDRFIASVATANDLVDRGKHDSARFSAALRNACSTLMNSEEFQPTLDEIIAGTHAIFAVESGNEIHLRVTAGLRTILPLLRDKGARAEAFDHDAACVVLASLSWLAQCHDDALSSPLAVLISIRSAEDYLRRLSVDGFNSEELEALRTIVAELLWRIDQIMNHPCRWKQVQQNANRMHFDLLSKLEKLKGLSPAIEQVEDDPLKRADPECLKLVEFIGNKLEAAISTPPETAVISPDKPLPESLGLLVAAEVGSLAELIRWADDAVDAVRGSDEQAVLLVIVKRLRRHVRWLDEPDLIETATHLDHRKPAEVIAVLRRISPDGWEGPYTRHEVVRLTDVVSIHALRSQLAKGRPDIKSIAHGKYKIRPSAITGKVIPKRADEPPK